MKESCILVYDILSSGIKSSLFTVEGKLRAFAFWELPLRLEANRAEQEPADWVRGMEETTRELLEECQDCRVEVISFSAMSQVCLCVDQWGNPMGPAITWSDSRAEELGSVLRGHYSEETIFRITGGQDAAVSSIRKLHWIKEKDPKLYEKTRWMLQCKDYLASCLTGRIVTDYTDAASTGAFDIRNQSWSKEILRALEISEERMPSLAASNNVVGYVTQRAAMQFGLEKGIPVVSGAGDVQCSAVGAGCVHEGDVYVNLGSTSWMACCTGKPFSDGQGVFSVMPHGIPGKYLSFVNFQTAGVVFKWLKNAIFQYDEAGNRQVEPYRNVYPYAQMEPQVLKSRPGAGGLLFLPHILDGNSSHSESYARGAFIGLHWTHTRSDMIRAALEGVTFEWKYFLELLGSQVRSGMLTVTGLASHEGLWLQIMADILGIPVRNTSLLEPPDSIGAAILAGQAMGWYPDFDQADKFREYESIFYPNPVNQERYQDLYQIYRKQFSQIEGGLKELEVWRERWGRESL